MPESRHFLIWKYIRKIFKSLVNPAEVFKKKKKGFGELMKILLLSSLMQFLFYLYPPPLTTFSIYLFICFSQTLPPLVSIYDFLDNSSQLSQLCLF